MTFGAGFKKSVFSLSFQMKTSAHQVVTGVTPTLVVETSLARISASATRASMEMDTLVLVRKQCACVFFHMCVPLVVLSTTKCPPVILCKQFLHVPAALGHTALTRHQPFRTVLVYRRWWVRCEQWPLWTQLLQRTGRVQLPVCLGLPAGPGWTQLHR